MYLLQLQEARKWRSPNELDLLELGERVAIWPRPVGRASAKALGRKSYKPYVKRTRAKAPKAAKPVESPRSGVVVLSDHQLMKDLGIQPIGWLE
jgi:hypothetical protein